MSFPAWAQLREERLGHGVNEKSDEFDDQILADTKLCAIQILEDADLTVWEWEEAGVLNPLETDYGCGVNGALRLLSFVSDYKLDELVCRIKVMREIYFTEARTQKWRDALDAANADLVEKGDDDE